jgi:hypothetical protein
VKSAQGMGLAMQKRMQRTIVIVFVTFLLRAIYASMFAVGFTLYDMSPNCSVCGDCQTTVTVMGVWFIANPGFHVISNLLSAPVALLLAMYEILLSKQDLDLLLPNRSIRDQESITSLSLPSYPHSLL